MGQHLAPTQCYHTEDGKTANWELLGARYCAEEEEKVQVIPLSPSSPSGSGAPYTSSEEVIQIVTRGRTTQNAVDERWYCCKQGASALGPNETMECLSYLPDRFEDASTIDTERSHARYSKIVVHGARSRAQRRSRAWEEWLRGALAGRPVTLLKEVEDHVLGGSADDTLKPKSERISATYRLDRGLSTLSFDVAAPPLKEADSGGSVEHIIQPVVSLLIDNIQVICPASDFVFFFDQMETKLDETEKSRAVLLQYKIDDSGTQRKRLCFLEESSSAKEKFVQALTALWLDKRNQAGGATMSF